MQQTITRPKIIYIAGAGHSGSTLLDMVLTTAPTAFSVGELKHLDLWLASSDPQQVDDTGARPQNSRFWSRFFDNQDKYLPPQRIERSLSFSNRLSLVFTGRPKIVPQRYQNEQLYTDIQAQAAKVTEQKPQVIVDSSKVLSRLVEINERTDLELYVVHIVRDVRGVFYSYYKRGRPSAGRAIEWFASNLGIARYAKKSIAPERYLRVHYEDFATHPQATVAKIAQKAGVPIDTEDLISNINNQTSYRFGGNGMRRKEITAIKSDEKWRKELPAIHRLVLTPLNFLFR